MESVPTICRKYQKAIHESQEADAYLRELTENIQEKHLLTWENQISEAQSNRKTDCTAMDVFDTTIDKGPIQFQPFHLCYRIDLFS